jgi:hypothetical protein
MTTGTYIEDTLVQQTTAEYLEQELGWESVYAYNNEDFGSENVWHWYERWIDVTRKLFRDSGGKYS